MPTDRRVGDEHTPVLSGKAVADWRLSIDKPIGFMIAPNREEDTDDA